jgi:hypothetical protein
MGSLGLSKNKFKASTSGVQHQFKIYGDGLNGFTVAALATSVSTLSWQIDQQVGNSNDHVEVKATLTGTAALTRDTVGDLTITVSDSTTDPLKVSVTYTN